MRPRSRSIITGCASALLFVFSLSGTTQPASPQPTTQPPPERETKQIDLSGIWLQGNEEWEIKHNPQDGTITIIDPIKHLPGRYVEYVGTVKGSTITATYHVTDPAVFNPDLPEKIRREHLKDQVKWTLKLELTKEGKLKGIKGIGKVSYNKKTLKITRVTPVTNQVALVRKGDQPILATPAKPTVEKKKPTTKGPPEPEDAKQRVERLRLQIAEEAQRGADELHRIAQEAAQARVAAEMSHQQALQELERARQEHAEAERRQREAQDAIEREGRAVGQARREVNAAQESGSSARLREARERYYEAEGNYMNSPTHRQVQEARAAEREALSREAEAAVQVERWDVRLFEARRVSERAEADAREAQRQANVLRYGPDFELSDPLPESTRTPVTPRPSPPVVRP